MNYLIAGGNQKTRQQKALSLGVPLSRAYSILESDDRIGIDAIRKLKRSLAVKQKGPTLVLIDPAQHLTIPAQNSFLKLLEEAPHNINFGLGVKDTSTILPTIASRCIIIKIRQEKAVIETEQTIALAKELLDLEGVGLTGAIEYRNRIKKELKNNRWADYFNTWLALLRDAWHLASGIDCAPTFPALKKQLASSSLTGSRDNIYQLLLKLGQLRDQVETGSVGPDRAASAFLLRLTIAG